MNLTTAPGIVSGRNIPAVLQPPAAFEAPSGFEAAAPEWGGP
jgi:hypothetical protein